jgi:2-polyprenyl-3-methyl-5-hydroxy-6-metoxy-1,4-benzoquinol methylase
MSIDYSDGSAVENEIRTLLLRQEDLSASTPIAVERYGEWPIQYHCSPTRSNLLRHLDFSGLDVLELGAGMGAISRFLAENARSLSVVEGTESRFAALSARLRDLTNWQGQVANIQDAELPQKYDVVCIIGVLEYAELYVTPPEGSGETPFSWFLKRAARHLKPDGVLILAIENQLGMKYLGGAPEDHTSRLFDGICGYPLRQTPRTFSRKDLLGLLGRVGFSSLDQYFPFPDYKMPTSVLSSRIIEIAPDLAADVAVFQTASGYGVPRASTFPDLLAARTFAQAGLLADVANSFLFCASYDPHSTTRKKLLSHQEQGELAWHYSISRREPTRTVFITDTQSEEKSPEGFTLPIRVEKHPLFQKRQIVSQEVPAEIGSLNLEAGPVPLFWHLPPTTQAISGRSLRYDLVNHAYYENWDGFFRQFQAFLTWSFQHWALSTEDGKDQLQGEALDALFSNVMLAGRPSLDMTAQDYHLIDLEWSLGASLSKSWFVFRNVMAFDREASVFTDAAPFVSFRALYERICIQCDVQPNFDKDVAHEAALQHLVTWAGGSEETKELEQIIRGNFSTPFTPPLFPRDPTAEATRWTTVRDLTGRVGTLENTLNTRPHRYLARVVQRLRQYPMLFQGLKSMGGKLETVIRRQRTHAPSSLPRVDSKVL